MQCTYVTRIRQQIGWIKNDTGYVYNNAQSNYLEICLIKYLFLINILEHILVVSLEKFIKTGSI